MKSSKKEKKGNTGIWPISTTKLADQPHWTKQVINQLVKNNDPNYQLLKAAEEFSELATSLLQYVLKKGRKTTAQDVIDEIGDSKIRMEILEQVFDKKKINKRYSYKLNKFLGYMKKNKYKRGI